ncbi:MAG: 16S rRNA (guanine(966)-N(2))-methyltransferase RsmD [Aquihabitans sp.]
MKSSRRGTLRVVSGTARGLRFTTSPGTDTRPTSDRVREAVFNALDSLGAVEGALVLDAYAGSGALGIEAASRGAAHVTYVERDNAARAVLVDNLKSTGLEATATVQGGDGMRAVASGEPWDLVLIDPPYAFSEWPMLLDVVAGCLAPAGVAVLESDRAIELPSSLHAIRTKQYGSTVVVFAALTGAHT